MKSTNIDMLQEFACISVTIEVGGPCSGPAGLLGVLVRQHWLVQRHWQVRRQLLKVDVVGASPTCPNPRADNPPPVSPVTTVRLEYSRQVLNFMTRILTDH